MQDEKRARDLKDFKAYLLTRAKHVFQNFPQKSLEYEELFNLNSISVQIHNQTCNFLAVEFPGVLENYAECP